MITPGSVKICSLREVEHAKFVLDVGADLFGLIFVPGVRRQVTPERAREIVLAVHAAATGKRPLAVGVFVDATAHEINAIAQAVGLDLAQLHGQEPPELIARLDIPAIKALRPDPTSNAVEVEKTIARYALAKRAPVAFLVDGFHEAHHGGEGIRADWGIASDLAKRWPVILAGGLTPENVAEAIETVRPIAVDVSSGVETDGLKDESKIRAFVAHAKHGFSLNPS